jgi:hypothetical protein
MKKNVNKSEICIVPVKIESKMLCLLVCFDFIPMLLTYRSYRLSEIFEFDHKFGHLGE